MLGRQGQASDFLTKAKGRKAGPTPASPFCIARECLAGFPDTNFWEEDGTRKRKERGLTRPKEWWSFGEGGKGRPVGGREVKGNPGELLAVQHL